MRTLCLILAAYLTLLACLPCADATVMLEHERATLAEDGHDHPDGEDTCTTFCFCACCGTLAPEPPSVLRLIDAKTPEQPSTKPTVRTRLLSSLEPAPDGQPPRQ